MCWTKNASEPSSRRACRYSTRRSKARPEVRTRSIGRTSDSIERIGLILSVEPSHAWAPPTRPPRRRNSSVSTANQTLSSRRSASAAAAASAAVAPARAAELAAITIIPSPAQAVAESSTTTRSAAIPLSTSWSRACSAAVQVPEMPPERWIETMSWPASSSGLVDGEEVAHGGLRGARHLRRAAEPRVEVVEVGDVGLARGHALEGDVERDLVDAELLDQRARHVVRRVGHDGDPGHGPGA